MSEINTDYISDIFEFSEDTAPLQQSLKYKYVKAYPSINSTNNGNVHSESNIRWLSRQFTKKPFIIPRDGNPQKDEFKQRSIGLNGAYTDGGMANIDGYVISIANNIDDIQYDDTDDTEFGSNDIGLIITQVIQSVILDFMNIEVNDYITNNGTVNLYNYINILIQDAADELHGGDVSSLTTSEINEAIRAKMQDSIDNEHNNVVGNIRINYYNTENVKLIDYINNSDSSFKNKFTFDIEHNCYYANYNVYIGFPDEHRLRILDKEVPLVFFEDNFGFLFIFDNADVNINKKYPNIEGSNNGYQQSIASTHCYPSTFDNRIKLTNININDGNNNKIIHSMLPDDGNGNFIVYDLSEDYIENTGAHPGYYERSTFTASSVNYDNVSSTYKITSQEILNKYCAENNIDITTLTSMPRYSDPISDIIYCIYRAGSDDTTFDKVMKFFSETDSLGGYIPIGFMNDSGRLRVKNLYLYNDSNAEFTAVEGYVTFLRRVCVNLVGDISSYDSDIISDPNGDNIIEKNIDPITYRNTWTKIFRRLEVNGATNTSTINNLINNVFEGSLSNLLNFFDVVPANPSSPSTTDLKFHHIYNKLIVPYVNNYLQIAWTSLYVNTINENLYGGNSKFTPKKCLSVYNQPVINNDYWKADIQLSHSYNNGNITESFLYNINRDVYTDYDRTAKYLCDNDGEVPYTDDKHNSFKYYIYWGELLDPSYQISSVSQSEDYINYLKHCCSPTAHQNTTNNFDKYIEKLIIPYKVTNLNGNMVNKMIDDDRIYVKYEYDNDVYAEYISNQQIPTNPITLEESYIQNVIIDLATMLPNNDYNDGYETVYYYNYSPRTSSHFDKTKDYLLKFSPMHTQNSNEGVVVGTDGFTFKYATNRLLTYVPTVFRLYKDSQDALEGRIAGTDTHRGIVVDYKLPKDLKESDLWINNMWMSNIRSVTQYNIETNNVYGPVNTDSMIKYLDNRNLSIFDGTKVYIDNNYTTLTDFINNLNIPTSVGVGKTIPSGTEYEYDGQTYIAGDNAEIFNDYLDNRAAGNYSHAEGTGTSALTEYSHSEGFQTTSIGSGAHSEGSHTIAIGDFSHAEGNTTTANGNNSHAEGNQTYANGNNSHAEGNNNVSDGNNSHTEGSSNIINNNTSDSHAEGYDNEITSSYAHIEGSTNIIYENADGSHAEGHNNTIGDENGTYSAEYSHIGGANSTITANFAFAHGYGVEASGITSVAFGNSTQSKAENSFTTGVGTVASQSNSLVIGKYNIDHTTGTEYPFVIGNGINGSRSDAFKIDEDGKIYIGNSTSGVDITLYSSNITVDEVSQDHEFEVQNNIKKVVRQLSFMSIGLRVKYVGDNTNDTTEKVVGGLPGTYQVATTQYLSVYNNTDHTIIGTAIITPVGDIKIRPINNWTTDTIFDICGTICTISLSS